MGESTITKEMSKETIENFFNGVIDMELEKKDISIDIKTDIESFSDKYNISKKAIRSAFKIYKKWLKDQTDYFIEDAEVSKLIDNIITFKNKGQINENI